MDFRLNKKQIDEVAAMFTELCEKVTDKEIYLNLNVRKNDIKNGETLFTYDVHAIYKNKLIYINMGSYRSLMDSSVTNNDMEAIITFLKGDK